MNCQDHLYKNCDPGAVSRRWFLQQCGVGLGTISLAELLARNAHGAATRSANPLAPKSSQFPAKAKNVIFLFMAGGPSHLELFDNKPQLAKFDGQLPPAELIKGYRAAFISPNSNLLGPRFKFARYGQSGAELSEILPHLAGVADELAIVKSLVSDAFNHAPGQILMNTGSPLFGRPSIGAWATYGLGSASQDLPGFIVFSSGSKGPSGGNSNWGSGFLPTVYQGVQFRGTGDPVLYLSNPPGVDRNVQHDSLDAIESLNRCSWTNGRPGNRHADPFVRDGLPHAGQRSGADGSEPRAEAHSRNVRRHAGQTVVRQQLPARPPAGRARRAVCRTVSRGVGPARQPGQGIKRNCQNTDQACAALIKDLKQRGLLENTLVVWGGEFGRTPMVQGGNDGRDHHPNCFTMWMAGGGVKPGVTIGESDDFGFNAVTDRVHVHDLHATILHLLGFDHTKLTYRFQGRDFRLTDVSGNVVQKLLA